MCDQGRPLGMDTTAGAQGRKGRDEERPGGQRESEGGTYRGQVVLGSLPSKVEHGMMLPRRGPVGD